MLRVTPGEMEFLSGLAEPSTEQTPRVPWPDMVDEVSAGEENPRVVGIVLPY